MPRIPQETIDEIRQKADIVEIIKEYIPLTPKGKNYFGICPFHADHSPSMSVSKEKQMYKCFSCGAAGNVFKFVSDYENISYIEAVQKVASKIGMNLNISTSDISTNKYSKEYEIMNLANLFYQNNLNTEYGSTAKEYLKKRGINEEMIKEFQLGVALDNNTLCSFLNQKKINEQDIASLGLGNMRDLKIHDIFVNRITFPIHDSQGRVVGFTARVYNKDGTPKYLNSKETVIFKKGNILFNYHRAKENICLSKKVIMVEGNMDAMRMYMTGFKNTIALMGTALTKDQIELLSKLRASVILMLDNDEAGETGTLTNGELLTKSNVPVEVVRLTGEKDPDEYILKNGPEAMQKNIDHPISYLDFKLSVLKKNKNLNDTADLAEYVKSVLKTLETADPITIDITLNKLVQDYHLSYDVLKSELKIKEVTPSVLPVALAPEHASKKQTRYEVSAEHILYDMMNDYKYVKIYENNLGFFANATYRGIANEIIYYANNHKEMVFADFLNYVEESPLKEEIYQIIKNIKDTDIIESSIYDYISVVKEVMWQDEIVKKRKELKSTLDENEKERIASEIVEYNKKIQEIKKERSVKNDNI